MTKRGHTGEGRLSNDGGSWTFRYEHPVFAPEEGWVPDGYPIATLPDSYKWVDAGGQFFLTGEGGYEGLMADATDGPRGAWGVILEPESTE